MTRAWIALTMLLATGCATNGILELTLSDLPAPGDAAIGGATHVRVQAESGELTLPDSQTGELNLPLPPGDSGEGSIPMSIVAGEGEVGAPLFVRLWFCSEDCSGGTCIVDCRLGDPEVRLRFERAFYRGEPTEYTYRFDPADLGTDLIEVSRCDVRGCVTGGVPSTGYCEGGATGIHFCER